MSNCPKNLHPHSPPNPHKSTADDVWQPLKALKAELDRFETAHGHLGNRCRDCVGEQALDNYLDHAKRLQEAGRRFKEVGLKLTEEIRERKRGKEGGKVGGAVNVWDADN